MIKAIETRYKGYRFRSRLEARWAVFFDALGIEWEYEKEGYDLGEAGWYLPDFWLPSLKLYIEIKPTSYAYDPDHWGAWRDKVIAFRYFNAIVCCFGEPTVENMSVIYCFDVTDSGGGEYEKACGWSYCHHCEHPTLLISKHDSRLVRGDRELLSDVGMNISLSINDCNSKHRDRNYVDFRVIDAVNAARAARFEFGEQG